ncbi:MAG: efflux RND transporter permease subunit [Pseudomonadales bacterium]
MLGRFSQLVIQWRYLLAVAVIALVAWLASLTGSIGFDTNYKIFFKASDPIVTAYDQIEEEFSSSYSLIYIVDVQQGDLFTEQRLRLLEQLSNAVKLQGNVQRVTSLANFQFTEAQGDDLLVNDLIDSRAGATLDAEKIRRVALGEPQLAGHLVAADGTASVIIANVLIAERDTKAKRELQQEARELIDTLTSAQPDVRIRLNGQLAIDGAIEEIATRDAANVESLTLLAILIFIQVLFRSLALTAGAIIVMLSSVAATAGFSSVCGYSFNAINVTALYVVLFLAVVDCIHLASGYLDNLLRGLDRQKAMHTAFEKNFPAISYTSITTALGFLGLNFSDSPPFNELGNLVAYGVLFAWFATFSVFPALVLTLPINTTKYRPIHSKQQFVLLENTFLKHPQKLFYGSILIVGIGALGVLFNETNDDVFDSFKKDEPVRVSADFIDHKLSGLDTLEFVLDSGETDGVYDPAYLAAVEEFRLWLLQQTQAKHVATLTGTLKRLNKSMHGDHQDWYVLPDNRGLTAQYLLLYELSLPEGLDLTDQTNLDKSALRLTVHLKKMTSREILQTHQRAMQRLRDIPQFAQITAASPALMFAHVGEHNLRSMLSGAVVALLLIFIAIAFAFRSATLSLFCMLPNLLPIIFAIGVWGYFYGKISVATTMVFSIAIGIVVDDTIHFVNSYLHFRKNEGVAPRDAVVKTYRSVGKALMMTTLVMATGFLIPSFVADMYANVLWYRMMIVVIVSALIIDLGFLPVLLVKIDPWLKLGKQPARAPAAADIG